MKKVLFLLCSVTVFMFGCGDDSTSDLNAFTTITTAAQLANIEMDRNYRLGADIDLPTWTAPTKYNIYAFSGTLDGAGHKITIGNISSIRGNIGLFDSIRNATVKNLTIEVVGQTFSRSYNSYFGALAGISNNSIIDNVHVVYLGQVALTITGNSSSSTSVGGIIAIADNTKITNCSADVDLVSIEGVGGIVNRLNGDSIIQNCIVKGKLTTTLNNSTVVRRIARPFIGAILSNNKAANDMVLKYNTNTIYTVVSNPDGPDGEDLP